VVTGIQNWLELVSNCFMSVTRCNTLLCQMNYIAAQSSVPRWNLNHSTGDVDQMSGSANDYLSLVNHVGWEGRVGLHLIMG